MNNQKNPFHILETKCMMKNSEYINELCSKGFLKPEDKENHDAVGIAAMLEQADMCDNAI